MNFSFAVNDVIHFYSLASNISIDFYWNLLLKLNNVGQSSYHVYFIFQKWTCGRELTYIYIFSISYYVNFIFALFFYFSILFCFIFFPIFFYFYYFPILIFVKRFFLSFIFVSIHFILFFEMKPNENHVAKSWHRA